MRLPRIRTFAIAVVAASALTAGVAVAGESQMPSASQCDPLQPGICEIIVIPGFCLPDAGCVPEIEIELFGARS